jgi:hypothetical protein
VNLAWHTFAKLLIQIILTLADFELIQHCCHGNKQLEHCNSFETEAASSNVRFEDWKALRDTNCTNRFEAGVR